MSSSNKVLSKLGAQIATLELLGGNKKDSDLQTFYEYLSKTVKPLFQGGGNENELSAKALSSSLDEMPLHLFNLKTTIK